LSLITFDNKEIIPFPLDDCPAEFLLRKEGIPSDDSIFQRQLVQQTRRQTQFSLFL
jgi:hypothetical protein